MRNQSYFLQRIKEKTDNRIYGNLPYFNRVKDLIDLYEDLSSMEKLEFQEAIRNVLKSDNPILVEIAISLCTGFIYRGHQKEQHYKTLQKKILKS